MVDARQSDNKVITGEVRLSYCHLFEPYTPDPEKQAPSYSVMLLIPKTDKKTLSALKKAAAHAAETGKAKFGNKVPPALAKNPLTTLHDCDEEDDVEANPEREGMYRMNVSGKTAPGVVDRDKMPILDAGEVYSGCYARVSLGAFAFNTSGNKGVSFGLNHVQKLRDGDPLGGRTRAEDDFDDLDDLDDEDDDLI